MLPSLGAGADTSRSSAEFAFPGSIVKAFMYLESLSSAFDSASGHA
jgi:hypothetical protein